MVSFHAPFLFVLAFVQCLIAWNWTVAASSSSSSAAPWQDRSSAVASTGTRPDNSLHLELPPTVFAPDGRLYNVEDLSNAVSDESDPSSNTLIAILCRDGVLAVTSSLFPESPYLQYVAMSRSNESNIGYEKNQTSKTTSHDDNVDYNADFLLPSLLLLPDRHHENLAPFCRISSNNNNNGGILLAATAGNAVESQILRQRLLGIAELMRSSEELDEIREDITGRDDMEESGNSASFVSSSPFVVARRLADQHQLRTMELGKGRILAAVAVLLSHESLWRVDPAGQFWKCQAVVSGRFAATSERLLWEEIMALNATMDNGNENAAPLDKTSGYQATRIFTSLSMDACLKIATKCLLKANHQAYIKIKNKQSDRNSNISPMIRIRAVTIRKTGNGRPKTQYFSHNKLLAFLSRQRPV